MNKIEKIADSILYEGYNLFPFRKSALKNQKRFNFGIVSPKGWAKNKVNETFSQQTEVLIFSKKQDFDIEVKIRFLQVEDRDNDWQKAISRSVENSFCLLDIFSEEKELKFEFSGKGNFHKLAGKIKIRASKLEDHLFKLSLVLFNTSNLENLQSKQVLPISFLSTHTILQINSGNFISLLEPKEAFENCTKTCENIGTFPVLVGDKKKQNSILSSPIILYDFPEVSENSFENFFDGTEIDELMVLSILALPDSEKEEIRKTDEKAAMILEKLENADAQDLMKLHASMTQK